MNRFDDEDSDVLGYPLSAYTPDDWSPQIGMLPPVYKTPEPTSRTQIVKKLSAKKAISLAEKSVHENSTSNHFNSHK
jgi:hypothetical protein